MPRLYASRDELRQLVTSGSSQLETRPESVAKVRLALATDAEQVTIHRMEVRLLRRSAVSGIQAVPQPIQTCPPPGAVIVRKAGLRLGGLAAGGPWRSLPLTANGEFPVTIGAGDTEHVQVELTDVPDLDGAYEWQVRFDWSHGTRTGWLIAPRDLQTSTAPLFQYDERTGQTRPL